MKYRLTKFPLIQLLLLYSSFVKKKKYFTAKIVNMHITSLGLTCVVMHVEAYLEPIRTSMVELLCENYKNSFRCSTGF